MRKKRLSTEQRVKNKREYNRKRDKEQIRKYILRLDREFDKKIIAYLDTKHNKNQFLRGLIIEEFERELKLGMIHARKGV